MEISKNKSGVEYIYIYIYIYTAFKWKIKEILKVSMTKHFFHCITLSNLEELTLKKVFNKTMFRHNVSKYPWSDVQISAQLYQKTKSVCRNWLMHGLTGLLTKAHNFRTFMIGFLEENYAFWWSSKKTWNLFSMRDKILHTMHSHKLEMPNIFRKWSSNAYFGPNFSLIRFYFVQWNWFLKSYNKILVLY